MVIGRERTNWLSNHPPACTCAECGEKRLAQARFEEQSGGRKIGRNERCPWGSGKKFKKCHGVHN